MSAEEAPGYGVIYLCVWPDGYMQIGGVFTGISGGPTEFTATCGLCGNEVSCEVGEAIFLDDARLCEHVLPKAIGSIA